MNVIEISGLKKKYSDQYVLNEINLNVPAGQLLGYIGPNGAGKSTTIKIISGLIHDFEGSVRVLGMDVRENHQAIKQRIGYIPEQAALYDLLTPIEWLRFTGKLYGMDDASIQTKSRELLQLFDLLDKAETRMDTYSKGMKQKVLLISGLMHNPEIIFLDEPLSGLDANAVILVKEILSQLKLAGKSIFYSSHIMDVVEKICDRIVIINKGEVIADDSFENLKLQAVGQRSLEDIFTKLTGGEDKNAQTASNFIQIIQGK